MTPFGRALWHIETHFNEELTQGGVAQIAGVSRFHLTRAFRDHFGLTPEAVRAQGHVQHLNLVEPIRMDETLLTTLDPRASKTAAPCCWRACLNQNATLWR